MALAVILCLRYLCACWMHSDWDWKVSFGSPETVGWNLCGQLEKIIIWKFKSDLKRKKSSCRQTFMCHTRLFLAVHANDHRKVMREREREHCRRTLTSIWVIAIATDDCLPMALIIYRWRKWLFCLRSLEKYEYIIIPIPDETCTLVDNEIWSLDTDKEEKLLVNHLNRKWHSFACRFSSDLKERKKIATE